MTQELDKSGKLDADRRTRFSHKYLQDIEQLIGIVTSEIAEKNIKVLLSGIIFGHFYDNFLL